MHTLFKLFSLMKLPVLQKNNGIFQRSHFLVNTIMHILWLDRKMFGRRNMS